MLSSIYDQGYGISFLHNKPFTTVASYFSFRASPPLPFSFLLSSSTVLLSRQSTKLSSLPLLNPSHMDPSSSRKSGFPKQSWVASRRPGFVIHDDGLVSIFDPKPSCSPYVTTSLAACNASSSLWKQKPSLLTYLNDNGLPPLPDTYNACFSPWKKQPAYFNCFTSNGLPPLADHHKASSSSMKQKHSQFPFLAGNGLDAISLADKASSSEQKQQLTQFPLLPGLDSILVADKASSSAAPKKQSGLFSFLSKSLSYAKLVFKTQKASSLEFRSSNPCFDPDPRYDLSKPILPDICVRCNQRFDLGKDGGIYMYKDKAYCSWDCRQEQMDIDDPPKKNHNPTLHVTMTAASRKRKTTSAVQDD